MKILWINHRDPLHPEAGGAEVRIHEIGRRLVRKGHNVTLIAERFPGSPTEEYLDGIYIYRIGNKYSIHIRAPLLVAKIARDYDVIVDDIAHGIPWLSSCVTRTPVVGAIHHIHRQIFYIELPPPLNTVCDIAERSIKLFYDTIITVSEATKLAIIRALKIPKKHIFIIPNGVDHSKYRPIKGNKFDTPTIIWIGRMKKYKRLHHLLWAFRLVKKAVSNAKLIVVGSGSLYTYIQELIKEVKLHKDVHLIGRVPESEKITLLQRSWALVITSKVEGCPLVILEAMACGIPIVGYDVDGVRELIHKGRAGLTVPDGDIYALGMKIKDILIDDELRASLGENAHKYSLEFNWEKSANKMIKVLGTLVG